MLTNIEKRHEKRRNGERFNAYVLALSLASGLTMSSVQAGPAEREQAKRIHDRLTGEPPTDTVLDAMETLIVGGDLVGGCPGCHRWR